MNGRVLSRSGNPSNRPWKGRDASSPVSRASVGCMGSSEVGIAGDCSATHAEHSAASAFTLDVLHSSSPCHKFRKAKWKNVRQWSKIFTVIWIEMFWSSIYMNRFETYIKSKQRTALAFLNSTKICPVLKDGKNTYQKVEKLNYKIWSLHLPDPPECGYTARYYMGCCSGDGAGEDLPLGSWVHAR